MHPKKLRHATDGVWEVARRQHGVVSRAQLLERGLGSDAVKHRLETGRLHRLWRGVYAVGRPEVSREGRLMAAVLSCGSEALLSHGSAAGLWGLLRRPAGIDVTVPEGTYRRRPGIRVHRRSGLDAEHRREVAGIPIMDPISTLVDLAVDEPDWKLERALNEADRLDLVDPEDLRATLDLLPPRPGLARLRRMLGGQPLTESGLERRFLAIVRLAGLSTPETQATVNGYRVDFFWPDLGLIVETDGWRYHRTSFEQAVDRRRDQAHTRADMTTMRFAEDQIRYEPDEVRRTLEVVASRLAAASV
jgi:very-short-patch-repair endonuclease